MHPDIAIIVGMSALDGAGILQAAKSSGRDDVLIFGFDDIEETKQAIVRGEIAASVIQKPYRMGYDSVSIIHDVLQGRSAPPHHLMDTEILTKDGIRLGDER